MLRAINKCAGRIGEGLDALLRNLQKHCPKCGGDLYRKFSFLDKIALFLPLPHTIYATHKCDQCHTRFRSFRSFTDLFLETAWVAALVYLGQWKLLALVCPITWLVTSYLMRDSEDSSRDTVAAGALTGILWILALVFGNPAFGKFFFDHSIIAIPLVGVMVLAPVFIVLILDRYTCFSLTEC